MYNINTYVKRVGHAQQNNEHLLLVPNWMLLRIIPFSALRKKAVEIRLTKKLVALTSGYVLEFWSLKNIHHSYEGNNM